MGKSSASLSILATGWACLALQMAPLSASTTISTVPSGLFSVNIAAGTGSSATVSFISFPLQSAASVTGITSGVITGITSNTISCSTAGWTAGELSAVATPYLIQFTSGAATGRTFLVSTGTANTATTVTIDPTDASLTDLTTLGVVANTDTFQIMPADTISSIFGTPAQTGVLGGSSSTGADQIQLYSPISGWSSYYYNTTLGWRQVGIPVPSANVVVRPDTGVIYLRYAATPMTLTLMGTVPSVGRKTAVANTGVTVLANNWPADLTLATTNISQLSGWVTGSSYTTADLVQVYSLTNGWTQYYNNGTHWLTVGFPIVSDSTPIPAGTAVIIVKRGSTSGQATLAQSMPYSL